MITIKDKHLCCGCSACVQCCPKQCIKMQEDEEGFLYPHVVDTTTCIDCGLCERVCPFFAKGKEGRIPIHTFAAKNKNEEVRANSSSGGLFSLFAEKCIENGGVVFGAHFDDDWNVVHGCASTKDELIKFRGSKYVQSSIGDSYQKAREYLKQGKQVLFSGTSCQIMGLKRFLGKDYSNLFTIDVICHGVPSPKVWKHYLKEILDIAHRGKNKQFCSIFTSVFPENASPAQGTLEGISFRDKTFGWRKSSFALYFAEASADDEKKQFRSLIANDYRNKYFVAFNLNLTIRHSCFNCPAKGGRCGSDITLADFWGIEEELPAFSDDKGVSLCLCNSEKGFELFEDLNIIKVELPLESAVSHNPSWTLSLPTHPKRDYFFKVFQKTGYVLRNIDKCLRLPFHQRYINSVQSRLTSIISFLR